MRTYARHVFVTAAILGIVAHSPTTMMGAETQSAAATDRVIKLPSDARHSLWIPANYKPRSHRVDVLVHFHGAPKAVLQSCKSAGVDCVVIGVTYAGLSSVYRKPFGSDRQLFYSILDEALAELRAQPDFSDKDEWGKLAVSSFSAGFGAIREMLKSAEYFERIDALFLVDSLYCGYVGDGTGNIRVGEVHPGLMKDFLRYAQASAEGTKTMIVTHCDGPTPGYASTRETADYLLEELKLTAKDVNRPIDLPIVAEPSPKSFRLYREAHRGNFWIFGSPGDNVQDHVQHFRHMGFWLPMLPLAKANDASASK